MWGWMLAVLGSLVAAAAFLLALAPVMSLYKNAMTDPLSDAMPEDGKGVAAKMFAPLAIAGFGALLSLAGFGMIIAGRKRRTSR
jgi:hypothetical protein